MSDLSGVKVCDGCKKETKHTEDVIISTYGLNHRTRLSLCSECYEHLINPMPKKCRPYAEPEVER